MHRAACPEKLDAAELAQALSDIFPEFAAPLIAGWANKFTGLFSRAIFKWVQAPLSLHLGNLDLERGGRSSFRSSRAAVATARITRRDKIDFEAIPFASALAGKLLGLHRREPRFDVVFFASAGPSSRLKRSSVDRRVRPAAPGPALGFSSAITAAALPSSRSRRPSGESIHRSAVALLVACLADRARDFFSTSFARLDLDELLVPEDRRSASEHDETARRECALPLPASLPPHSTVTFFSQLIVARSHRPLGMVLPLLDVAIFLIGFCARLSWTSWSRKVTRVVSARPPFLRQTKSISFASGLTAYRQQS